MEMERNIFRIEDIKIEDVQTIHQRVLERVFDGGERGFRWGRFSMRPELSADTIYKIKAAASDAEGELEEGEEEVFVNQPAILLHKLRGRYLKVAIELQGSKKGWIREIAIHASPETFLQTFPEIYREENSFFERYLSVFATVYMNFECQIEHMAEMLDVERAPGQLLSLYASWLGCTIPEGMLEEEILRRLMKELYALNKGKGTKWAIERMVEIITGGTSCIVERNRIICSKKDLRIYEILYGESLYDVTVIITLAGKKADEGMYARLLYLLNQWKPVRSRLNLVFLEDSCYMDSYCYLGMNARLRQTQASGMDEECRMNGTVCLSERK